MEKTSGKKPARDLQQEKREQWMFAWKIGQTLLFFIPLFVAFVNMLLISAKIIDIKDIDMAPYAMREWLQNHMMGFWFAYILVPFLIAFGGVTMTMTSSRALRPWRIFVWALWGALLITQGLITYGVLRSYPAAG